MARVIPLVIVLCVASAVGSSVVGQVAQSGGEDAIWQAAEIRIITEDAVDEKPRPVLRDPTEPGEAMRDLVAPLRMGHAAGSAALAMPRVLLKGRIIGPVAPPAAIVDLQGSVYVVRQDSELTVDSADSPLGGLTLRVTEINVSEVRIEVLPFRKILILR